MSQEVLDNWIASLFLTRGNREIAKLFLVGQDRVRAVRAAQADHTQILHQMGRLTKFTPQVKQAVIELKLQHPNFADLQTAQIISERFTVPIARATINQQLKGFTSSKCKKQWLFWVNLKRARRNSRVGQHINVGVQRKTRRTQCMYRRACNVCIGLYWALTKYGARPDFHLAPNRIRSHSIECHFGMIRSALKGDPRWDEFLAAQIKAAVLQNMMRRLEFPSYIRRFVMQAGCVVLPDTHELIHIDFGNNFVNIIDCIREMTFHLSDNNPQEAFHAGNPLMETLVDLHRAPIAGKFHETNHESDPWSGGAITTMWHPPLDRKPTQEEILHVHRIASE
jgi:hypothetical protein